MSGIPYAYEYPITDAYVEMVVKREQLLPVTTDRFLQNFYSVYQHGDSLTIDPHVFPRLPKDVLESATQWDAFTRKHPKWNWMGTAHDEDDLEYSSRFSVKNPPLTVRDPPLTVTAAKSAQRQSERRSSHQTLMTYMAKPSWKL